MEIIFCGDLNSTADSAVYQLFTVQQVPNDHDDWNLGALSNSHEIVAMDIQQPFKFRSACGIPKFTTYTENWDAVSQQLRGFSGALDHIFITEGIDVLKSYELPSLEAVTKYQAIPSFHCPSDHLPLICDLTFAA